MRALIIAFAFLCAITRATAGFEFRPAELTELTRPVLKGLPFNTFYLEQFFEKETKAVVLIFSGTQCPLLRQYLPTLRTLNETYAPKGVRFLGIYSDRGTGPMPIALHTLKEEIPYRTLWDIQSRLAKLVGATTLTEVAVFDSQRRIVYQGAIDDRFRVGGRRNVINARQLETVLEALTKDETPQVEAVAPTGCTIEFPLLPVPIEKTFYRDVLPILQQKCQVCHRPGQIGAASFRSFLTYEDVYDSASTIRDTVLERRMPPYNTFVNPKYGKATVDHALTVQETRTIETWVKNGAPPGDVKDAPPPRVWPETKWEIGTPDMILSMPKSFKVPATGTLEYQFFRIPLNFPEDRWVGAIEMKPGVVEVVHHMQVHMVPSSDESFSGTEAVMKLYGLDGEKARIFHGFVPGDPDENVRIFPPDQATRIPKKTDLVLEMHYTPYGEVVRDQSSIGIRFAKSEPKTEVCAHAFRAKRSLVTIPINAENYGASRVFRFLKDVNLHQVRAHMHALGKSLRIDWVRRHANGIEKELFAAFPIFDFNWQRSIHFAEPVYLHAGQELEFTGYWDNSTFNPNNSNPPRERGWGIQTTEEMLSIGVKFSIAEQQGQKADCFDAIP